MQNDPRIVQILQSVEQNGMCVETEVYGNSVSGIDMVFPHVLILLCLRGTARIMYDMQEFTIEKNDFGIVMPGHFSRCISCSEDCVFSSVFISVEMVRELKKYVFSHDYGKFNYAPKCHLTDLQAKRVMELNDLLGAIVSHDTDDLLLRQQMLLSLLAVAYEFINYYRREQDEEWAKNRPAVMYTQFCNLVVEHYRENRNVNYYARLMDYDPRYFSKVFRQFSGGLSPLEWIQQYVAAQAKRIMDTHPKHKVKDAAIQLGFPSTGHFCRYFKRATGIYPQTYKNSRA